MSSPPFDAVHFPRTNRLLAALPPDVMNALRPDLEMVLLPIGLALEEVGLQVTYIYFPHRGVVSMVMPLKDRSAVGVANVGSEGMVGVSVVLGADTAPLRAIVQVPGAAARIGVEAFRRALDSEPALRRLLLLYVLTIVSLLARNSACHRIHRLEERCARWLLSMHDQMHQNSYPLTQEFLGLMLGVSRPSVSAAASKLQRAGLIRYVRGWVAILDRRGLEAASCECYGATKQQFEDLMGGGG